MIDRQPSLSLEYIASESKQAHEVFLAPEAILGRVFAFHFASEQVGRAVMYRENDFESG